MSKLPITALAAVITLGMHTAKSVHDSLADDGKITFGDAPKFVSLYPYVGPAFEHIADVPKQAADIDPSELEELKKLVMENIGEVTDHEKLVAQIDASLNWVHSTYVLVQTFKS